MSYSNNESMRFIDTETASVKMTGGVPFKVGVQWESDTSNSNSCSDDEISYSNSKDKNSMRQIACISTGESMEYDRSFGNQEKDLYSDELQVKEKDNISTSVSVPKRKDHDTINAVPFSRENTDEIENLDDASKINCVPSDGILPTDSLSNYNHSLAQHTFSKSKFASSQFLKLSNNSDIFNTGAPHEIPAHMLINSGAENITTHHRFNPFNQVPMIEEDYFSDNCFHPQNTSYGSSSPRSSFQNVDINAQSEPNGESDVTFAELGLAEDHFSHPQGHFGLSGIEELELAIDNCKDMIRETEQGSDKQKNLVMKLVQLRIKLQEIKDGPEPVANDVKVILSHKMILKSGRTSKYYCERCNGVIWGMLQYWYRCSECGYRCHEKCLQQILRTCAKAKVLANQPLIIEICPRETNDLASQIYRCAECRSAISFKTGQNEPRLCDYTGRYYCEFCHWNDSVIIPARVLHNWDFSIKKVSRSSKQFLKLVQQKSVIRIQDINPMLFVYVDELNEIKKLREEMMVMKKYIISCPSAMAAKLLLLLEKRQHFVESSDRYTMQDLMEAEDILLPELVNVHSTWAQHIKVDCQLCQGRGFCCELCNDKDILFPFDNIAVVCAKCSNVLHRHCFAKKSLCPRCERRDKRTTPP